MLSNPSNIFSEIINKVIDVLTNFSLLLTLLLKPHLSLFTR